MNGMSKSFPRVDTHEALSKYQSSLPVSLIATPRAEFVSCKATDSIKYVIEQSAGQEFDYLPVVSGVGSAGGIIGVFRIPRSLPKQDTEGLVGDTMQSLSEKHLIGADASIVSFITDADLSPFRLVVAGHKIMGLVSISDLQRLPVRAALFAIVTNLEMIMSDVIQARVPDRWKNLLAPRRREYLNKQLEEARRRDTLVEPLFYTQFCDKRDILSRLISQDSTWRNSFVSDMKTVEKLRNNLAHANNFAADRSEEIRLCETVRTMISWTERLGILKLQSV